MIFNRKRDQIKIKEQNEKVQEMKKVLINAIRMQALYSEGKIRIFETSNLVN